MPHLSKKLIAGKEYLYAVHSVKLPDGRVGKITKRVEASAKLSKLKEYFDKKEIELRANFARKNYAPLEVHDGNALEKMEEMRLEYKRILRKLSANQLKDLFDRFTVNFTYESNALEGNSLTLKQVAIVIFENGVVGGKDLREIYETRNAREVVDLVLHRKLKASEKDCLKMHEMLVRDMGVPAGYKKVPNYLHLRQVVTTPPEKVPLEMKKLFSWLAENKRKMHALQLASRFHGRFERIHPFEDGNGRTGRFLLNATLLKAGYPPLIIRKTQKIAYLNALQDSDEGRPVALENFLYERLKETHERFFKIYAKYLK